MRKRVENGKKPLFIIGIDEVGRGPLAGPVSVVAVLMTKKNYLKLKRSRKIKSLHNSKVLSEKAREEWYEKVLNWKKDGLLDFAYASTSSKIIDSKGIAKAIRMCVTKVLKRLEVADNTKILLDGSLYAPEGFKNQKTIIQGDEKESIISLASIVAKVRRDNYMKKLAKQYSKYGFEVHKGYGTEKHRNAIKKHGMCKIHRRSFCSNLPH